MFLLFTLFEHPDFSVWTFFSMDPTLIWSSIGLSVKFQILVPWPVTCVWSLHPLKHLTTEIKLRLGIFQEMIMSCNVARVMMLNRWRNNACCVMVGTTNFHFLQLMKQEFGNSDDQKFNYFILCSCLLGKKWVQWSHHALKTCSYDFASIIIAFLPLCLLFFPPTTRHSFVVYLNWWKNTRLEHDLK